ncbi:MAG TPA: 23S rRNA (adenine(2503)-C(2))-methyltransferase RlmN [Kofleriaceae bacterium]|nr:23S rRNA (adenine(2503)-C(2))-methyltransferase RlmN [Kofleriaceae bacterium]
MLDLRTLSLDETAAFAAELGEPRYRGEQIWRWVHGRGATSLDDMTDVSKPLRARMAERATLGTLDVAEVQRSVDGTRKLRLTTRDGRSIESVLIPDGDKMTQCISSQVGCALDCQFCATAKLGLTRNLDAGEIVDQVYRAQALLAREEPGRRITNLVYMGMGEPLHNYQSVLKSIGFLTSELGANFSQRRITVSTVGLVPAIEKLGKEDLRPNLAVSLNASSDEVRDQIMPVNRKWPIARLLAALRAYPLERRRRITFEYVLLAGVNDSDADADRLGQLLRGMPCKVNLIPWNPHPGAPYRRPAPEAIERFQNRVKERGLAAYLRTPRGDDIAAACGQLANRAGAPGEALIPVTTVVPSKRNGSPSSQD